MFIYIFTIQTVCTHCVLLLKLKQPTQADGGVPKGFGVVQCSPVYIYIVQEGEGQCLVVVQCSVGYSVCITAVVQCTVQCVWQQCREVHSAVQCTVYVVQYTVQCTVQQYKCKAAVLCQCEVHMCWFTQKQNTVCVQQGGSKYTRVV